ncbi:helix-turn-helix domain-containing protein [Natrinema longum]|uniref:Helix-turn-helix domain-containing protein n=1 Tax=Natrinema longum TaxID=370324 RepID=A0A8A2U9D5_9EURY|nr:helix-turn-helix domain-containing protein [Natrinema longum]MBZ6494162.1 helix-turn-helix domain-containing protein [Natrinema longum]QSW84508.1 helix-turn-helix domain-containing protein [Natrinema longum]
MKQVSFSVTFPDGIAHPLHRRLVSSDDVSRAELLMWGPMGTVTTLLWCDGGRDAVADLLSAVGSITTTAFVDGSDGTYAFVHQTEYEFADAVLDLVSDSRIVFLPPVTFRDTGTVQFEAVGESDALTGFYTELTDLVEGTIDRVHEFDRRPASTAVTDRQQTALEAAVAVGYYDVPRSGTVEDVADELGCAGSTAGELLRKAEAELVARATESG